jgi:PRC-barrel domain
MATPSIETVRGWRGRVMVDRDRDKIGEVVDIYLDNETDRPEWAVVRTGLFGLRSTFVPLAEAREVGDELQVPHQRLQVKQAPNIEPDGQLSAAEEAELYRHYGLDYDSVTLDSGAPAGQALGEAAGQTDEPEGGDQAGATATEVPEPASTAAGGLVDTGLDGEPGTPTPETGSSGLVREPDTGLMESEAGRRGARDELSATGGGQPVAPVGQDRLSAGEGVSRPFVYETPGRSESGAGPHWRQPGQVRLRRYLVTEVVTDTEAGQRHEVRVQSEPVSDAEGDAVLPAPDRQNEPTGQDPNGSEPNDWFRDESDPRH